MSSYKMCCILPVFFVLQYNMNDWTLCFFYDPTSDCAVALILHNNFLILQTRPCSDLKNFSVKSLYELWLSTKRNFDSACCIMPMRVTSLHGPVFFYITVGKFMFYFTCLGIDPRISLPEESAFIGCPIVNGGGGGATRGIEGRRNYA